MRSFPLHERPEQPFRLSEAARRLQARQEGGTDPTLRGIAPLAAAGNEELAPLMDRRYLSRLGSSRAGALLVSTELLELLPDDERRPRIVVEDGHQAMARLLEWLHPLRPLEPGIHATAVLGSGVELGDEVGIGPYAVLEPGVRVGDGVRIGAHSVVGAGARIGDGSLLHPHVVVYPGTVVGRKVILHSGVRVGVDGFGYVLTDGEHRKVPQVGRCVIEDGVEVGANSTFDRGSIGDTRVGAGTKVDNLVQLGHNVTVGPLSILVSQVGIAGSTTLGTGVMAAGQVGTGGHLHVGDQAVLAGQSGVTGDIPPNSTYMGFPARPRTEFLRMMAAQARVTELIRRVRELERTVAALGRPPEDPGGA